MAGNGRIGLAAALALATIAGCEDLPTTVETAGAVASATPRASFTPFLPGTPLPGAATPTPTPAPTPSPSAGASPTPIPTPTPTPKPSPTPNPKAALDVELVSPTADSDFTGDSLTIEATLTPPNAAVTPASVRVLYDGVELDSRAGTGTTYSLASWDPHRVAGVGNRDLRPIGVGRHTLEVVATSQAGVESRASLAFDKPFVFRGWRGDRLRNNTFAPLPALVPAVSGVGLAALQGRLFSLFGDGEAGATAGRRALQIDVSSPVWTTEDDMPARRTGAGVVGIGDRLWVVGGSDGATTAPAVLKTVYHLDAFGTTAVPAPDLPAALLEPAVAVSDGFLYVAGGSTSLTDDAGLRTTLYRLPVTAAGLPADGAAWETRAPLPGAARKAAALVAYNGKLWLAGGLTAGGGATAAIAEYDPGADAWTGRGSLPRGVGRLGAAPLGGYLWFFGGDAGSEAVSTNTRFDPATYQTQVAPSLPAARAGVAAAVLDDALFITGGYAYSGGSRVRTGITLRADAL